MAIVDLLAREKMINVQVVRMCAVMKLNFNVTVITIVRKLQQMGKLAHVSQGKGSLKKITILLLTFVNKRILNVLTETNLLCVVFPIIKKQMIN